MHMTCGRTENAFNLESYGVSPFYSFSHSEKSTTVRKAILKKCGSVHLIKPHQRVPHSECWRKLNSYVWGMRLFYIYLHFPQFSWFFKGSFTPVWFVPAYFNCVFLFYIVAGHFASQEQLLFWLQHLFLPSICFSHSGHVEKAQIDSYEVKIQNVGQIGQNWSHIVDGTCGSQEQLLVWLTQLILPSNCFSRSGYSPLREKQLLGKSNSLSQTKSCYWLPQVPSTIWD